ncbi:MAG: ribosome-associated translation inhibitor RaiA [Actinomycetia bacterium]|nr:ribosome-associated translation inhibitor RaiA [Actinomycetes bacterium]
MWYLDRSANGREAPVIRVFTVGSYDESRSRTGVNLTVKGRNLVLTDAISRYAEEKLGRLGKYVANGTRCEVELWTEKNPSIADNQVVEVTIFTKGPVIRAREASPDIYASIDLVFAKLERQVKKYRGKLVSRYQGARKEAKEAALASEGFNISEEAEEPEAETPSPTIVKTKQFMTKPMTPEEACLQLELVGHDFFVFTNSETNETAVVYRRRDGNYGLIEAQS